MNQIFTLKPYLWNEVWVFDDPDRGLYHEALVAGMPELIRKATQQAGIENPQYGFLAMFSKDPFPGATIEMQWVRSDDGGGNTYSWQGQEGWLCPAPFRYFDEAPRTLYLQVRAADVQAIGFEDWFNGRVRQIGSMVLQMQKMSPGLIDASVRSWLHALARDAWREGEKHAALAAQAGPMAPA